MTPSSVSAEDSSTPPLRVVVAWRPDTDGSEAVDVAAMISRSTATTIQAIHAIVKPWPLGSLTRRDRDYARRFTKQAKALTKQARREFAASGLGGSSLMKPLLRVEVGSSDAGIIHAAAADFTADLVILGSQPAAPKGRFRPGSLADALLHSATVPLALAPRGAKLSKKGITRVTVAFIDTPSAQAALAAAGALAQRCGSELRLITLAPQGAQGFGADLFGTTTGSEIIEWQEAALAMLDRGADTIRTLYPDLDITLGTGIGTGWAGALDDVKWRKGDVLYLGSSSVGPIERVFLGSDTANIVRNSPVPVIVHPAQS